MWISKNRLKVLEKKVADLEKNQLLTKENIESNREILLALENFRKELLGLKIGDANAAE